MIWLFVVSVVLGSIPQIPVKYYEQTLHAKLFGGEGNSIIVEFNYDRFGVNQIKHNWLW